MNFNGIIKAYFINSKHPILEHTDLQKYKNYSIHEHSDTTTFAKLIVRKVNY
jgi:hypothetical protein